MREPLVSVIIPFYNEDLFLERAVLSVCRQAYSSLEVILINDGSEDDSQGVAERLCADHPFVRLINTDHCGLGRARNIGLAEASGDFVLFLDGDDELERDAVQMLMARMETEQSDIVVCRFLHIDSAGNPGATGGWTQATPVPEDCVYGMYEHTITCTVWAKLYRADIVRDIRFPEDLWFEDRPFLLQCFLRGQKVSFEEAVLWKIHSRPGSITRRLITVKRIEDSASIFAEELKLVQHRNDLPRIETVLYRHHLRVMMNTLVILYCDRSEVKDLEAVQDSYAFWLQDFRQHLKESRCRMGLRDRTDLAMLGAYRILGWPMAYRLLAIFRDGQIRSITRLRRA